MASATSGRRTSIGEEGTAPRRATRAAQEKIAKLSEDGKQQDAPSQEPEGSKTSEADSSGDDAESNKEEVEPGKRKKRTAKKRYCVCRSTDDSGFMICCDKCGEWYHGRCIGLQPAKAKAMQQYSCLACESDDGGDTAADPTLNSSMEGAGAEGGKAKQKRPRPGKAAYSAPKKPKVASASPAKGEAGEPKKESAEKAAGSSSFSSTSSTAPAGTAPAAVNSAAANAVRSNVERSLSEALYASYDVHAAHDHPDEAAVKIEEALAARYGAVSDGYKARYRALLFNLKDARNGALRQRVLLGELPAAELVQMSSQELAPQEVVSARKQRDAKTLEMETSSALEEGLQAKLSNPFAKASSVSAADNNSLLFPALAPVPRMKGAARPAPAADTSATAGTESDQEQPNDDGTTPSPAKKVASPPRPSSPPVSKQAEVLAAAPPPVKEVSPPIPPPPVSTSSMSSAASATPSALSAVRRAAAEDDDAWGAAARAVLRGLKVDVDVGPQLSLPALPSPPHDTSATASGPAPVPAADSPAASSSSAATLATVGWRGHVQGEKEADRFLVEGIVLAQSTSHPDLGTASELSLVGRMERKALFTYLTQLETSSSRAFTVLALHPQRQEETFAYISLYEYLHSRARVGVLKPRPVATPSVKEAFLVPMPAQDRVPGWLRLPNGAGPLLKDDHDKFLVVLIGGKLMSPPPALLAAQSRPTGIWLGAASQHSDAPAPSTLPELPVPAAAAPPPVQPAPAPPIPATAHLPVPAAAHMPVPATAHSPAAPAIDPASSAQALLQSLMANLRSTAPVAGEVNPWSFPRVPVVGAPAPAPYPTSPVPYGFPGGQGYIPDSSGAAFYGQAPASQQPRYPQQQQQQQAHSSPQQRDQYQPSYGGRGGYPNQGNNRRY